MRMTAIHTYIDVTADSISVNFQDELRRKYLAYQFLLDESKDKFFLREAIFWEFEDDKRDWKIRTMYDFVDDLVYLETFTKVTAHKEESTVNVDTSGNWENKPTFGNYENFLKEERL